MTGNDVFNEMNRMSWRGNNKWPIHPHEIIRVAKPFYPLVGVYFLISGDDVIYVGQSINIHARVAEHRNNGVKFDRFHFIECDKPWLNDLEAAFIWSMSPSINQAHNTGKRKTNEANLRVQSEIDRWHQMTPDQRFAEAIRNMAQKESPEIHSQAPITP